MVLNHLPIADTVFPTVPAEVSSKTGITNMVFDGLLQVTTATTTATKKITLSLKRISAQ